MTKTYRFDMFLKGTNHKLCTFEITCGHTGMRRARAKIAKANDRHYATDGGVFLTRPKTCAPPTAQ